MAYYRNPRLESSITPGYIDGQFIQAKTQESFAPRQSASKIVNLFTWEFAMVLMKILNTISS